jgi:hypothetical protein
MNDPLGSGSVESYQVETVFDQWYERESMFCQVRADDGGNLYILRQQISTPDGASHFARQDKSVRHGKSAALGDPHLPSVEHKVESADDHPSNR